MLSIVVVSFNHIGLLGRCLAALVPQAPPDVAEIIVVRDENLDRPECRTLEGQYVHVRWIHAPPNSIVPQMRRLGLQACRGDLVALLEDDCLADPTWVESVLIAHQDSFVAIGGAVEPGPYTRGLDWAVYFCEYANFLLPLPTGRVSALPGNNVSYKRWALAEPLSQAKDDTIGASGFYDVFIHQSLQRAGQYLKADARLVVHNINTWKFVNVSNLPFQHGRGFAAMRFTAEPRWRRVLLSGLIPGLPFLLISRLSQRLFARRRLIKQLFQALPWIVLFYTCWSAGEFVGYLAGPGHSLKYWR